VPPYPLAYLAHRISALARYHGCTRTRSPTKAQPKRILGRPRVRIEVCLVIHLNKLFRLESESVVQQLEAMASVKHIGESEREHKETHHRRVICRNVEANVPMRMKRNQMVQHRPERLSESELPSIPRKKQHTSLSAHSPNRLSQPGT